MRVFWGEFWRHEGDEGREGRKGPGHSRKRKSVTGGMGAAWGKAESVAGKRRSGNFAEQGLTVASSGQANLRISVTCKGKGARTGCEDVRGCVPIKLSEH